MANPSPRAPNLDHFFSSSAARLDRWRDLNAKAQAWAADARGGKPGGARAAVEAALAEVRPLEDFFAFPGQRLMKTLAERIASDDALGTGRLVRRISGALLSGSYRNDSGEWESADDSAGSVPDRMPLVPAVARRAGPISKPCSSRRRRPPTFRRSPRRSVACGAPRTR